MFQLNESFKLAATAPDLGLAAVGEFKRFGASPVQQLSCQKEIS